MRVYMTHLSMMVISVILDPDAYRYDAGIVYMIFGPDVCMYNAYKHKYS